MKTMLSLKSSKAVSINSARHFHSSISISPGTRRIRADGRQHESKQRLRRHGRASREHTEHPVLHVWPLRTCAPGRWRATRSPISADGRARRGVVEEFLFDRVLV